MAFAADAFLVLVLVDSLSTHGHIKDILELDIIWVTRFNKLSELTVRLEEFVEAAEDATAEHHNALFQRGSDKLLGISRLAPAATDHLGKFLARSDLIL